MLASRLLRSARSAGSVRSAESLGSMTFTPIPQPTTHYLSIWGQDRVGLVKDITQDIVTLNGNIENSSMTILDHHFSMIL